MTTPRLLRWEKLGKIFDPRDHKLNHDNHSYAQAPQTLVFNDFVRVFFSIRTVDSTSKFLSHICYVDFTKDFKNILKIADREVIGLGRLGCYDEHGIFPLNILAHGDRILGFIGGWSRRRSVMIDGSIGLSISADNGATFTRIGDGPIMAPTLVEPFLVADPCVRFYNDKFHMWYIFGRNWITSPASLSPERVYKIAYAHSTDGINWTREGRFIIPDTLSQDECQALPTVLQFGGKTHMFFCYRHATNFRSDPTRAYKLGYAFSEDLATWHRADTSADFVGNVDTWDSDMMCYPHLFSVDDNVFLLYNGNEFGKHGFGLARLMSEL